MTTRYRLAELLADGRFRSGEWLGQQLGISRAAVWKKIATIRALGLDVQAVRGKGYRLTYPFVPLESNKIISRLSAPTALRLKAVDVFQEIDSTNDYLKRSAAVAGERPWRACCAEWQHAGRGRRGRRWVSPYGGNLYLSLAGEVNGEALASGGLSLAVAVTLLRILRKCGADEPGLKWPNDIYSRGRKIAGTLVELAGESAGLFQIIIGVGINLRMSSAAATAIDQPWTDLSQSGVDVDRNQLAASVIEEIMAAIDLYLNEGLRVFSDEWREYDLIAGRAVALRHGDDRTISGIARGIDANGALLIEYNGAVHPFHAGEVSVRLS
ncbi:MAG: bifunctional biotin--[acetyl-CoA-carboxylase] ligase/biotin operon repressor BirA [Thiogranum sp.]|nr:bifunctional biotin--[acetyl-CoA-carboxylase] ligase/biotin operon repressor BirA [Thiogranum sp.]